MNPLNNKIIKYFNKKKFLRFNFIPFHGVNKVPNLFYSVFSFIKKYYYKIIIKVITITLVEYIILYLILSIVISFLLQSSITYCAPSGKEGEIPPLSPAGMEGASIIHSMNNSTSENTEVTNTLGFQTPPSTPRVSSSSLDSYSTPPRRVTGSTVVNSEIGCSTTTETSERARSLLCYRQNNLFIPTLSEADRLLISLRENAQRAADQAQSTEYGYGLEDKKKE